MRKAFAISLLLTMNGVSFFLANFFFLNQLIAAQLATAEYVVSGRSAHNPYSPSYMTVEVVTYAPAVYLHALLPGLSITACFAVYILILLNVTLWLCWRISGPLADLLPARVGALLGLFYVLAILPQFPVMPQLGQRENMSCILILPYLFLVFSALSETPQPVFLRIIAGIMGVLGFCLKPVFAIVFLASEFFVLIWRRRFTSWVRAESMVIGGLGLAYALSWPYIDVKFFNKDVHLISYFYKDLIRPYYFLAVLGGMLLLLFSAPIYVYAKIKAVQAHSFLYRYGFTLFFASLVVMLLQARGFNHHLYLPFFFMALTLILVLASGKRASASGFFAACFFLTFSLFYISRSNFYNFSWIGDKLDTRKEILGVVHAFAPYIQDEEVTLLTVNMFPIWQVFSLMGGKSSSPAHHQPYFLTIYRRHGSCCIAPDLLEPSERYYQDQTINFLLKEKPRWVLAQDSSLETTTAGRVGIIDHLLMDPRFRVFWQSYKRVAGAHMMLGQRVTFDLYQRQ